MICHGAAQASAFALAELLWLLVLHWCQSDVSTGMPEGQKRDAAGIE